jgi:diguanylate cyclase (GGDEF)-like protein
MADKLIAENRQLRSQLKGLIEQAHRNQQIMQRHQEADLRFIGAESFRELMESIFATLTESSELDVVTLSLLDPEYEIRRILIDLNIDLRDFPTLFFAQDETEFPALEGRLHTPLLGPYSEQLHGLMFPEPLPTPACVAVVPLKRKDKLIGFLSLGSFTPGRFASGMATDFIEHRASIIAICIENVINKELLKHIGMTDRLTGINNRRYIELRLLEEVGRTCRHAYPLSCMYIDVDHFKKINDSIGHQAGDEVLRQVAALIKAELRLSDAFSRYGGEEFLALLIDTASEDAANVAERVRASVEEHPLQLSSGQSLRATISIGIASIHTADAGADIKLLSQQLVLQADQALYQAKSNGRNQVVMHYPAHATF